MKSQGKRLVLHPSGLSEMKTVYSDNGRVGYVRIKNKQVMCITDNIGRWNISRESLEVNGLVASNPEKER